jgi:hypothetical protein
MLGGNGTYFIDASDPAYSNWLRYFNAPKTYNQENVVPVLCAGAIIFMASRDIKPGTELLVWYGDSYGRFLGVNRIHPGSFEIRWHIRIIRFTESSNSEQIHWAQL